MSKPPDAVSVSALPRRALLRPPCAGLLAALLLSGLISGPLSGLALAQEPSALEAASALEQLFVDSIQRCEKSVVAIARVKQPRGDEPDLAPGLPFPLPGPDPTDPDFIPNEFGAGVVIDPAGLILTNYHVIGDPESSAHYVWSEKRPFPARVVAADPWYDLAVLKIEASGLAPMPLGDGRPLRKGQIVIALGNPYAIARDGEVSASWGIISNLLRRAPRTPQRSRDPQGRETLHHYGNLIQTDAKLNLGYSGGALINLRGEMIGLTTSYAATAGFETAAGFAIPVDDNFRRIVESLKQGRKPEFGFLGVQLGRAPLAAALRRAGYHGALVARVLAATPAADAELRGGDVISHINGEAIHDDDDLIRLVSSLPPDTPAQLTVLRGDLERNQTRVLSRQLVLSKKHVATLRAQFGTVPEPIWRGIQVDYATATPNFDQIAHRVDPEGCVYVLHVLRDSAGWNAGLRAGMLISHVQRQRVARPAAFYSAVDGKPGDIRLRVITDQGATEIRTVSP